MPDGQITLKHYTLVAIVTLIVGATLKHYTLVAIVTLIVGATLALAQWRMVDRTETQDCINQVEQRAISNTRRIEALERGIQSLEGLPEQISGMSSDIRYLRKSVEVLMDEWRKDRRSR